MKRNYKRWPIFERDSYTCVLCNRPATDIHHIQPRSEGGLDAPHNLVSLCRCHHDLLHGVKWPGVVLTTNEAKQIIVEYLCDYYATENPALYVTGYFPY